MKKMLLVFAHPDDESFSCAGTVAKYVQAGWKADLLCATRGEEGKSGIYTNITREELGSIRQKELENAGIQLGLSSITLLNYPDGKLSEEHAGELEDKIVSYLKKEIPDIVITFDTTGISNHPDHKRICFATTFAFQKYASWIRDQLKKLPEYSDDLAPKLFYACMPATIAKHLIAKKIVPSEMFGKPWLGTPDKYVTNVINIRAFKSVKKKALLSHHSQIQDVNRFLSYKNNPLLKHEYFILRMHGITEVFMGKNDRVAGKL